MNVKKAKGKDTPQEGRKGRLCAMRGQWSVYTRHSWPRRLLSVVLLIATLSHMVLIFMLSNENKEASGSRSDDVTAKVAAIVVPHYKDMTPEAQDQVVQDMGYAIRKLAHFSEYALLAVLCGGFCLATWDTSRQVPLWRRRSLRWFIPAGICLLYAASDEIHQIFSHRGPAVTDVMIDFTGSLVGLCLLHGGCACVQACVRRYAITHGRKGGPRPGTWDYGRFCAKKKK